MKRIKSLQDRLDKLGIKINISLEWPHVYLEKVNGVVVTRHFQSNRGFVLAYMPFRSGQEVRFSDTREIFKQIRSIICPKKVVMTAEQIHEIVCEDFGVNKFLVKHRRRKEAIPRHVYSYLLREYANYKWEAIGEAINRTHATAIHSYRLTDRTLKHDFEYGFPTMQCIKRCRHITK